MLDRFADHRMKHLLVDFRAVAHVELLDLRFLDVAAELLVAQRGVRHGQRFESVQTHQVVQTLVREVSIQAIVQLQVLQLGPGLRHLTDRRVLDATVDQTEPANLSQFRHYLTENLVDRFVVQLELQLLQLPKIAEKLEVAGLVYSNLRELQNA